MFLESPVLNTGINAGGRRTSSVPVQKLMSSALRSLVPH